MAPETMMPSISRLAATRLCAHHAIKLFMIYPRLLVEAGEMQARLMLKRGDLHALAR